MFTRFAVAPAGVVLAMVIALSVLAACGATGSAGDANGDPGGATDAIVDPTPEPAAGGGGGSVGVVPTISTRSFVGGTAHVVVSGQFEIDADVAINTSASYADGGYTWLQFGDSGSEPPNALVTVGDGATGVSVGLGTYSATIGSPECPGEIDVTDATITGHFKCTGVTGYDSADQIMGNVDLEVTFTANS